MKTFSLNFHQSNTSRWLYLHCWANCSFKSWRVIRNLSEYTVINTIHPTFCHLEPLWAMCNIWTTFFKDLLGLTKQARRFSGVGTVGRSVFTWSLCLKKTPICWMQASQDGSSSETGRNKLAKHRLSDSLISSRWEKKSECIFGHINGHNHVLA